MYRPVADPGGVRLDQTTPPLRPDPGVVAENAPTGCIRVVYSRTVHCVPPLGGHFKKVGGTVKKNSCAPPHFQIRSGVTDYILYCIYYSIV